MNEREYIVRLRMPKGTDPAEGVRRLQKILKRLGRSYGIKAVECSPAKPKPKE